MLTPNTFAACGRIIFPDTSVCADACGGGSTVWVCAAKGGTVCSNQLLFCCNGYGPYLAATSCPSGKLKQSGNIDIAKLDIDRFDIARKNAPTLPVCGNGKAILEKWLAELVGENAGSGAPAPRWENRGNVPFSPRRVRADLKQLAEDLDREYLELAAT